MSTIPGKALQGSWANLCEDLLVAIVSRSYFVDRIRCRAVCKNWKQLIKAKDIKPDNRSPWVMIFDWHVSSANYRRLVVSSLCKLYDPSHQKTFMVEDGYKGEERRHFVYAEICDSKNGWVLFKDVRYVSTVVFFAYSPFTNEAIQLPEWDSSCKEGDRATFSSNPTSPDCVFFATESEPGNPDYRISMCRRGDQTWKTILTRRDDIHGTIRDLAYLDGNLYCLFSRGTLGVFTLATQQFRVLKYANGEANISSDLEQKRSEESDIWGKDYLIESDRKLLKLRLQDGARPNLSRFESSQNDWMEDASLGDRAMFVNYNFCTPFTRVGEVSELGKGFNFSVYCPDDDACPYEPGSFIVDQVPKPFEPFASLPQERRRMGRIWIQPPSQFIS